MTIKLKIVSGIFQKQNKVLLCLRRNTKDFPNYWSFPCGHIEEKENPIDALRRELFEELGVQLIDCQLVTTLIDHQANIENHIYQVTEWRGELINQEPELCKAVQWFKMTELPSPLTPPTKKLLNSLQ